MDHRNRVMAALNHVQPDKVPIDLGGCSVTSMVAEAYEKLKKHFGIETENKLVTRYTRVVAVDEKILSSLDIDTRGAFLGAPTKGVEELGLNCYRDQWGIEREKPEHSYYYDQRKFPLSGEITISDIMHYPWPDPDDPGILSGVKDRLKWIRENTDCALVLGLPNPFIHTSQYLRGYEDWYCDMSLDLKRLEALFDAILEINSQMTRNILKEVGQDVDVVWTFDDLGVQNGLMFSRDQFLKCVKLRLQKYFNQIHDLSPAKLLFHCCGSIASIIEDLIEIGVDALNPLQVSAAGMDPVELKRKYRGRMAFWGGIDTQKVLPRGSVHDVMKAVEDLVEVMGEGGGYILSSVHNIQPDVPLENILAMFEHAREYIPSYMK